MNAEAQESSQSATVETWNFLLTEAADQQYSGMQPFWMLVVAESLVAGSEPDGDRGAVFEINLMIEDSLQLPGASIL